MDATISPLAAAIADADRYVENAKKARALLTKQKRRLNALIYRLAGCDNVSISSNASSVWVSATMKDLDGFKCRRLATVIEKFLDADDTRTSDHAASLCRLFQFYWRLDDGTELELNLHAYAKGDSNTCRKVVTGKRRHVTTEKTYAIVCD